MGSENPALNTLIYSSIFNFPLSKEEIWDNLISDRKISRNSLGYFLSDPRIKFDRKSNLYYLNNSAMLGSRNIKHSESKRKVELARKALSPFKNLSTISLMGISGSVAVFNAQKGDDIDIFLICKRGTVWITRLILIIYLKVKGLYRSKDASIYKDKLCLNMFISDQSLHFSQSKQNLYFAKEITQLLPLFDRNNTYYKLLGKNKWIWSFLPNFKMKKTSENTTSRGLTDFIIKIFLTCKGEFLSRLLQKVYMRGRKSEEIITDNILAFHPTSYENQILSEFSKLSKKYY